MPLTITTMSEQTDHIAVVGGGLVGPLTALALHDAGVPSLVLDARRDGPPDDGRCYALGLGSVRVLQALGLWDRLGDQAQPIEEVKVSDSRPGGGGSPFVLHFPRDELEDGPVGFMVEDRHLRPVLNGALAARGIALREGWQIAAQEVCGAGITLTTAQGQTLTAPLAIAADGRHSATARRAGIRRVGWAYGQTALVCTLRHERSHHGIARQVFLPPGPLAILPLRGDRVAIVWSEGAARAAEISGWSDSAFLGMLAPRVGDFLGALSLEGARFSYPLELSLAQSFVAPRLALVGDAAHGVHPIAGQGLNAGIRDVAALAQVLHEARLRGEDPASASVLARYQSWRRFGASGLAAFTDGCTRLFSNDLPLVRAGRGLGLGLVNALPGLKRRLQEEAAGVGGHLPRLMQGSSLSA